MSDAMHRVRAGGAAAFLLVAGAALGIAADRAWLAPPPAAAMALTAEAMSERLGLSNEQESRLVVLLDSLHAEVLAAAADGPEALRIATDDAHRTIAASLPLESRPAFHAWMQEHHDHLMRQMGAGS
jgi:hypothetical protein